MNGQELFEYLQGLSKPEREDLIEFKWWSPEDVERHLNSLKAVLELGYPCYAGAVRLTKDPGLGRINRLLRDRDAQRKILMRVKGVKASSFEEIDNRIDEAIGEYLERRM